MAQALDELIAEAGGDAEDLYANRREWKCVVAAPVAARLRAAVAERLVRLEYVPGVGVSRVHTIYFDSEDFALYRRAVADDNGNLKFRLRSYSPEAAPTHFFECKVAAIDGVVKKKHKARFRVPPGGAATLLGAGAALGDELFGVKPKFWRKALALMEADGLRPRLTVCYDREAFESADGRLRVTFDVGVEAAAITHELASPWGPRRGLAGQVVLEIKHLEAFPEWLSRAIEAEGLPPEGVTFSKFKSSVAALFPEALPLAPSV